MILRVRTKVSQMTLQVNLPANRLGPGVYREASSSSFAGSAILTLVT